ncbi:zinc C3HC4 type domain-containing protein [Cryptosporidium andersoni]|uniref:RING-type E3 ubiquitin transferase n=1 Tax=Cryptosporidium andersoni TaxID=117008 RepID=A0A1J4MEU8_9CRYT|nr:zinc C3HC4 type domain-containing protein [Cryptosporidium andersoni]
MENGIEYSDISQKNEINRIVEPSENHIDSSSSSNIPNPNGCNGTSFECNICFETAHEPIVTRCGHLYCWSCMCLWLEKGYEDCPVCKAGVTQENVIPLYGRGCGNDDPRKKTKPRPRAERPEARQRHSTGHNSSFREFQSSTISFSTLNFPMLAILANPLGAILSLGAAQRLIFGDYQNSTNSSNNLSNEEYRAQLVSNIALFLGIIMMLYILFLE